MGAWFILLVVLHVILCLFLVLLILVQNDKGGGLAGAFGGMGGSAAFTGSSTATFLTTLTGWMGVGVLAVILGLNALSGRASQVTLKESELKAASKGLSTAIPGAPQGNFPVSGAIPGLGGNAPAGGKAPAPGK